MRRRVVGLLIPGVGAALVACLVAAYAISPLRPVAWNAPRPPASNDRRYKLNHKLDRLHLLSGCGAAGPEALAVAQTGDVVSGYSDGSIRAVREAGRPATVLARTGGRPLGLAYLPDGSLVVADQDKGLLRLSSGRVETLSTEADGQPYRYLDGLATSADGREIYFTDATRKFRPGQDAWDIIEHAGEGRLFRYDVATRRVVVLTKGLQFANGVAVGPRGDFVLVAETGAYRVQRVWLSGPKAGAIETLLGNLPGFPDNLSSNGSGRFWVSLHSPREPVLDGLAPFPALRRLLAFVTSGDPSAHRPMALAFDEQGQILANVSGESPSAYGPVTEAREVGERLYLGSDQAACPAWLRLDDALQP